MFLCSHRVGAWAAVDSVLGARSVGVLGQVSACQPLWLMRALPSSFPACLSYRGQPVVSTSPQG